MLLSLLLMSTLHTDNIVKEVFYDQLNQLLSLVGST